MKKEGNSLWFCLSMWINRVMAFVGDWLINTKNNLFTACKSDENTIQWR